VIVDDEI